MMSRIRKVEWTIGFVASGIGVTYGYGWYGILIGIAGVLIAKLTVALGTMVMVALLPSEIRRHRKISTQNVARFNAVIKTNPVLDRFMRNLYVAICTAQYDKAMERGSHARLITATGEGVLLVAPYLLFERPYSELLGDRNDAESIELRNALSDCTDTLQQGLERNFHYHSDESR